MNEFKFLELLLEDRIEDAHSLLLEYVTGEVEILAVISHLSTLAIDISDPLILNRLEKITERLEAHLL
jgi:hypothetical protein